MCSITEQIKSHTHEHQDIRWKPNVGENHLLQVVSIFYMKLQITILLYWCSLIPARRLQPAEGYNLLSFSKLPWKGAPTPFALVLAKILVRRCWPTIFFLSGITFHTFSDLDIPEAQHYNLKTTIHSISTTDHWSIQQPNFESLNHWNLSITSYQNTEQTTELCNNSQTPL